MHKWIYLPITLISVLLHLDCQNSESKQKVASDSSQPEKQEEVVYDHSVMVDSSDFDYNFTETKVVSSPFAPSTIVRKILQDKTGNYWLATWSGIIQYNGQTFVNHTNKNRLRRWHVFGIHEEPDGTLWFATIGAGIYKFDGLEWTNYTTKDGLAGDRVTNFYQEENGNLWIGTESGISIFNNDQFSNLTTEQGLSNHDINSIIQDEKGNFWIGTRGEAMMYDGKTFSNILKPDGTHFTNVRRIIRDRKDQIWLGGNDGLWTYDRKSFQQLDRNFTGYIYEDSAGKIWTSTDDGNGSTWVLKVYSTQPKSSMSPQIHRPRVGMLFDIMEDNQGHIWFGSLKGVGKFDGKEFEFFSSNSND